MNEAMVYTILTNTLILPEMECILNPNYFERQGHLGNSKNNSSNVYIYLLTAGHILALNMFIWVGIVLCLMFAVAMLP